MIRRQRQQNTPSSSSTRTGLENNNDDERVHTSTEEPEEDNQQRPSSKYGGLWWVILFFISLIMLDDYLLNTANNVNNNIPVRQQPILSNDPASSSDAVTLVECKVSTPNSLLSPQMDATVVANGVLRINVFPNLQTSADFLTLVADGYYDGAYIFRAIKGFVLQFGFRGDGKKPPKLLGSKGASAATHDNRLSNIRGTLTLVSANSAQVWINMGNNTRLDKEGTTPFATLDEEYSMAQVADKVYTGYQQGMGQIPAIKNGQVSTKFPEMSRVDWCRIVTSFSA